MIGHLQVTINRGYGDCEDIVIVKMAILGHLGYKDMQMTVVRNTPTNSFHAVLIVRDSNTNYVLDNITDAVMPDIAVSNYYPLQSFTGTMSYLHGYIK